MRSFLCLARVGAVLIGSLSSSCGGALSVTPLPDGTGPVVLERLEPDVFQAVGPRTFRILGRDFAVPGDVARVVFTAVDGTPFLGGTSAVLEADGLVESGVQIRGQIPEPLVPRQLAALQDATIEVFLARGGFGSGGDLRGRFEPAQLTLTGSQPRPVSAAPPSQATLVGTGFDPVGGRATIEVAARRGAPFEGRDRATVVGVIQDMTRIRFTPPRVGDLDYGTHPCDISVALVDADGATVRNSGWTFFVAGPPVPPPFAIDAVVPRVFSSRTQVPFVVRGTAFTPAGGAAVVRFTADSGTPFRAGTGATLDVAARIDADGLLRGVSPRVSDLRVDVTAAVRVTLPDGRVSSLPPGTVTIRADLGTPRLVINEVDYDQPGIDAAEFVELFNGGDGEANASEYTLEFVNGFGGGASIYKVVALGSGTVAPGGYFVVAADALRVPNTDLDVTPNTNLIQNGAPDAIALLRNGVIVDALSYEGDVVAPYREGSGSGLEDIASTMQDHSLARWLDGFDTHQNNVDFELTSPPTPGTSNVGTDEIPFAVTINTAGPNAGHLLRIDPTSGRGGSVGQISSTVGLGGLGFLLDGGLIATDRSSGASRLLYLRRDASVVWDAGPIADGATTVLVSDLAVHPTTGVIYALSDEPAGTGTLFTVHPATAVATRIGSTPLLAAERNGGIAFAGTTLTMTTRAASARLLTINPATAAALTSAALDAPDTLTLAARPSDQQLFAVREGGALIEIAASGATTHLGTSGAGEPGAIAFAR